MTVISLSTEYAFTFDALTALTTSINLSLRRQRNENSNRIKLEDDNTDLKLKTKYEFDDNDPPPPYPLDTIEGNLNTEPENIEEKVKQVDIVEPKLEKLTQAEQSDNNRKSDNDWLNQFLAGAETTKQTLQELNDQAIAAVLSEGTDAPQIDTKIDIIFIDDNELFPKDELTDENKAFIKTLLNKANYKDILDDNKDDQQKLIQDDVPPDPLFFPTENEIFDDILPPTVPLVTPKTEFLPDLTHPQKTGIKSVDDKNYEDYLKVLPVIDQSCLLMKRTIMLYQHQKLKLLKLKMSYLQHQQNQYSLFPKKLLNYQNQYSKLICLKTLTIFQQLLILIKLVVQITLIMSTEILTLTLLRKHLTMTMT